MSEIAIENSIHSWIENNNLTVTFINDKIIEINEIGKFLLVNPKDIIIQTGENSSTTLTNVIFDPNFQIFLSDDENELADQVDFLLFQFGDKWYYTNDLVPDEIKEFKYIGKPKLLFDDITFPYLAIHGGYELCNGSRPYSDWVKKAKFLGINILGIAEENTLAGTLAFQDECIKAKIKPIIGETVIVLAEDKSKFSIKLYVENEKGWQNLLLINSAINVNNNGEFINIGELFICNTEGIICVLTPECEILKFYPKFITKFEKVFYQLDFVEWASYSKDEQWLLAMKDYFQALSRTALFERLPQPLLICDSYYLDKSDHEIKKTLNNLGKLGFKSQSRDQYFKTIDDIYLQIDSLFPETDNRSGDIIAQSVNNVTELCNNINFKITTGLFRLPQYEMNEFEKSTYADNEELFWSLIQAGIDKKFPDNFSDKYYERLQEEVEVIKAGGFIDYFLIISDILNWAASQNILYGIGRGSAAGSLVSYLLGVVGIDPLQYGLLFSRFLNAGRLGKSLPDIDLDFSSDKRDDIKRYIEFKYGKDYVTAIGTYSTFKVKGALKDLCREKGVDYQKTNFVSSLLDKAEMEDKMSGMTLTELFKFSATKPEVKEFIQKNYSVIEKLPLCLSQSKTSSVHASGVVIVPKQYGTIYKQMPIKKIEEVLVSEWEGDWIDKAGFLKLDILGIKQLDKISAIQKLIFEKTGEKITFDDINEDLENVDVFALFKQGLNSDVFQLGSPGLMAYCKELKPDNINDLIAAVSLYRPGPMDTGMHKKYIKIKNGIDKLEFEPGTEIITKDTYGQIVYQEQIMQICSHMGGFNLVEADDIRKVLGKKLVKEVGEYKNKFIDGCLKNGYDKDRISDLWDKMEAFAQYSFNKSHAAAYAITGYYCQWYKFKYPLQFWTVSMQYADEKDIINRISEISKTSNIEVAPVDINHSTKEFFADDKTSTIFWSINSIKWVGDKGVELILADREANGNFFSIEDFCDRLSGKMSINKRTITNLILAGAFDKVEKINPEQRGLVINKYFNFISAKQPEELLLTTQWRDYQWILKQKELTGFGFIDYLKIIRSSRTFATLQKKFKEINQVMFSDPEQEEDVVISGILLNIIERKSKKGPFGQLEIVDNTDTIYVTLWNESYEPVKKELHESKNKIIILSGKITFDSYKQANVVHSKNSSKIEII